MKETSSQPIAKWRGLNPIRCGCELATFASVISVVRLRERNVKLLLSHLLRSGTKPYFSTIAEALPSEISSCQIPNDDDGPPTLVLENPVVDEENPPDPTPGLMRTPTFCDWLGNAAPILSSRDKELKHVTNEDVSWKDSPSKEAIDSS